MQNSKVAVISNVSEFSIFKTINADVYMVYSKEEAIENLKKTAQTYKIIILPDSLAERINQQIREYDEKVYPIILSLSTSKGSLGVDIKQIVKRTKDTLGIDIFKEL